MQVSGLTSQTMIKDRGLQSWITERKPQLSAGKRLNHRISRAISLLATGDWLLDTDLVQYSMNRVEELTGSELGNIERQQTLRGKGRTLVVRYEFQQFFRTDF